MVRSRWEVCRQDKAFVHEAGGARWGACDERDATDCARFHQDRSIRVGKDGERISLRSPRRESAYCRHQRTHPNVGTAWARWRPVQTNPWTLKDERKVVLLNRAR